MPERCAAASCCSTSRSPRTAKLGCSVRADRRALQRPAPSPRWSAPWVLPDCVSLTPVHSSTSTERLACRLRPSRAKTPTVSTGWPRAASASCSTSTWRHTSRPTRCPPMSSASCSDASGPTKSSSSAVTSTAGTWAPARATTAAAVWRRGRRCGS